MTFWHLLCVIFDGHTIISHLECNNNDFVDQALRILDFLRVPGNIQRLKDGIPYIYPATDEEVKTANNRYLGACNKINHSYVKLQNNLLGWPLNERIPAHVIEEMAVSLLSLNHRIGPRILDLASHATESCKMAVRLDLDSICNPYRYHVNFDSESLEFSHVSEDEYGHQAIVLSGLLAFGKLDNMSQDTLISELNNVEVWKCPPAAVAH